MYVEENWEIANTQKKLNKADDYIEHKIKFNIWSKDKTIFFDVFWLYDDDFDSETEFDIQIAAACHHFFNQQKIVQFSNNFRAMIWYLMCKLKSNRKNKFNNNMQAGRLEILGNWVQYFG